MCKRSGVSKGSLPPRLPSVLPADPDGRGPAAALERLDELAGEEWTRDDTVERLRGLYDNRRRRLSARAGSGEDDGYEDDGYEDRSLAYQRLVRECSRLSEARSSGSATRARSATT